MNRELLYKKEVFEIIGLCMEVHNELGHGFLEIVYKDTLQHLLTERGIDFEREKKYEIYFQKILLKHHFYADFVIRDKIIVEVKCVSILTDEHYAQAINYLKVSGNKLALLINFARGKLEYKRIIY